MDDSDSYVDFSPRNIDKVQNNGKGILKWINPKSDKSTKPDKEQKLLKNFD